MEHKLKIRLTIDGKEVAVDEGVTILEAARQNSIYIPTLCHHPALSNWGGCRICVVEVDGGPRLVASCVMPVREGMEVVTSNERINESRRTILEFLFAERNHNCMICPQSGDCELQSLAYELQMDHLTVPFSFQEFPTDITNEHMGIDHNRCILCGRCIRACNEIAGAFVLNYQNRGSHALVGMDLNETREGSTCLGCGVCLQVCPTGAIFNRYRSHYAVKGHTKEWERIESTCPQCGLLCPIVCFVHDNNLIKIEGELKPEGDGPYRGQLCHRGRFEPLKSPRHRLLKPMVRGRDGKWESQEWETALDLIAEKLSSAGKAQDGRVCGLVSTQCSNEELFLFRDLLSGRWQTKYVETLEGPHLKLISESWKTLGKPLHEASWKTLADSDFILAVSAMPHANQSLIANLMRRALLERKIKVATIGPVNPMDPWPSLHHHAKQSDVPVLLDLLLSQATESKGGVTGIPSREKPTEMSERSGLDARTQAWLREVVAGYVGAHNPMLIAGEGLIGDSNPKALKDLMDLARLKGPLSDNTLRLIILKPNGNSAGAYKLGLSADGEVRGKHHGSCSLVLLGGEEITDSGFLGSIGDSDFLAVITPVFQHGLADKARVFIPRPLWMEQDGTYTALDGEGFGYVKSVLEPPEGVRASWETLIALARRSMIPLDYEDWHELQRRARKAINRSV